MFKEYIENIFSSWEALQFAINQQTGGPESNAIGQWMNEVTAEFFRDNEDLQPDEVAEFLTTIMDQELNTLVDDGSDLEISRILCQVYRYHVTGNTVAINDILAKLPKAKSFQYKIQSESDNEEMEACQDVSSQIKNLSLSVDSSSAYPPPGSSSASLSFEDEQRQAEEADGWTMIKKGKRKNR